MIKHFLGAGLTCPSEATMRHPIDLQKVRDLQNKVDLPQNALSIRMTVREHSLSSLLSQTLSLHILE